MLTVACVLWQGDFMNTDYLVEHVERLEAMVSEYLHEDHRFVCLSNVPVPCERIEIDDRLPGYWAKLHLFDKLDGHVLYLDLDVTVMGSLDDLAETPDLFTIVKDFRRPKTFNSSVMTFYADAARHVYPRSGCPARRRGDQQWIGEQVPWAMTYPERWVVSYKDHVLAGKPMDDVRVVAYHGQPKPWSLKEFKFNETEIYRIKNA